jgi:putative membrane protein
MNGFLLEYYLWIKALHIISVIAWMAGMFYLPRLFVYHAERATPGGELDATLQIMERRLLRGIINPAMVFAWTFGLMLVLTPGVVDWGTVWPWVKGGSVITMSALHGWLATRRKDFVAGRNRFSGRTYRLVNEIPTVLVIVIVFMVILKP